MRSEKEMMELIIEVAEKDDRIRAAFIGGSRCNPNAPKDIFQDYDIEYIVTDTKPFREDKAWIDQFGERLYMQYPEEDVFYPSDPDNCYAWLIQFADGVRLDLTVCTLEYRLPELKKDRMYRVLLDKDNCLPNTPCNTGMSPMDRCLIWQWSCAGRPGGSVFGLIYRRSIANRR